MELQSMPSPISLPTRKERQARKCDIVSPVRQHSGETTLAGSLQSLVTRLLAITQGLTGTLISADVPLVSAGLDSMAATELSTLLSLRLDTELSPTLLFDHPSLRSVASSVFDDQEFLESRSNVADLRHEAPTCQWTVSRARARAATTLNFGAVAEAVSMALATIQGTLVGVETPLMASGLDSLAATELVNALAS